jgi:four helix bundle protein
MDLMTALAGFARDCGMEKSLRVLDAAQVLRDEVNRFLDHPRSRALYAGQLRDSAQSIPANIKEGYGREGKDRRRFLGYAVASAEETDEHIRGNWRAKRLRDKRFWFYHNRLVTIIKMITTLMDDC